MVTEVQLFKCGSVFDSHVDWPYVNIIRPNDDCYHAHCWRLAGSDTLLWERLGKDVRMPEMYMYLVLRGNV